MSFCLPCHIWQYVSGATGSPNAQLLETCHTVDTSYNLKRYQHSCEDLLSYCCSLTAYSTIDLYHSQATATSMSMLLARRAPAGVVLSVVPELRQVILRALHSGRPSCAPMPQSYSGRPDRSAPPHTGRELYPGPGEQREWSGAPIRSGGRTSTGRAGAPPAMGFGLKSPVASSSPGRTAPTSSRRLAELPERKSLPTKVAHAAFPSTAPAGKGRDRLDFLKALPRPNASLTHSEVTAAKPHPFIDYPLNESLIGGLSGLLTSGDGGALHTTPIQSISLARLLETPSDALLAAETGSGKTLAYMLPLLHHLKLTDTRSQSRADDSVLPPVLSELFGEASTPQARSDQLLPRSLVISPTHELTRQSTGVAKALCHDVKLSVVGMSSTKEAAPGGGRKGVVDVLIGTSGGMRRMLSIKNNGDDSQMRDSRRERKTQRDEEDEGEEHVEDRRNRGSKGARVGLGQVEWVVIDEADVLLGMSYQVFVESEGPD